MQASLQLVLDCVQLRLHLLLARDALQLELSGPGLRADVREAQELERLRLRITTAGTVRGGVPPELDQPCLLLGHLQRELRQSFTEIGLEPLGVVAMLEARHVVVGETHDDHVTAGVSPAPLVGPQVEDVVKVDVGEQRRDRCPLDRSLRRLRPLPLFDDPGPEPLADQSQDSLVRDPVLEELLQPALVEPSEEVADVSVEHPVHLLARDPDRERVQRIMRRAPRPEPVGETKEVALIDRVQHLDQRPLEDLVLQRGDPERPLPPVRLGDEHPARRLRPVRAPLDPGVQIPKVRFEIPPVVRPRHPVDARRRPRADRPVRQLQPLDGHVV